MKKRAIRRCRPLSTIGWKARFFRFYSSIGGGVFRKTGKPVWRCKGGRPLWNASSPVVAELAGRTCVVFGEDELVGADIKTGDVLWKYVLGRTTTMVPIILGDKVFYTTYPNRGNCGVFQVKKDGKTKTLWANREIQNYHVGYPVLKNNYLYGIDCRRTEYVVHDDKVSVLKCVDFRTGKVKWKKKKMGWGQVLLVDGKLLIQREGGNLVLAEASPDSYREIGRASLPKGYYWSSPAFAGGRIFFRTENNLICVGKQ